MSITGVSTIQARLLQQMLSKVHEDAGSSSSFGNLLADEVDTRASDGKGTYTKTCDALSSLLDTSGDMSGLLLASLLNSSGSASNMMLLSLGNALYNTSMSNYLGTDTSVYTSSVLSTSGYIPSAASIPAEPAITSSIYNRDADLYTQVIRQFSVETNPRYEVNKRGHNDTYCNIFVWDVTSAMGAEIPHYYNAQTGEPMTYKDSGAREMTANRMYNWLHEHGEEYSWHKVSAQEAQKLANDGHPVVTALYNGGGHGHVQVVCPSNDGRYDEERGVTIAQAGRNLTSYRPITKIYNASLPKVVYFAHV